MNFARCLLALACLAPAVARAADDVAVPIERVHLCCDDCVEDLREAVTGAGATGILSDQETSRLVIFAPDIPTARKAVAAMVAAGYYGRSRNPEVPIATQTGAKDATVTTTDIEGVHLCCSSCVEQAKAAVNAVPGVKEVATATHATTIRVTGEFNEKAAVDALLDVGFSGKVSGKK